jgi:hypothetical protein
MRLTTASVQGLKLDTGVTDKIVFDETLPGFGIRVRASGARTWIYQYKIGGRTRRLVLGHATAIKLARAREIAGELHAKVRLGGDPASEKREKVQRALDTFGVYWWNAFWISTIDVREPNTRSPSIFASTRRRSTPCRLGQSRCAMSLTY